MDLKKLSTSHEHLQYNQYQFIQTDNDGVPLEDENTWAARQFAAGLVTFAIAIVSGLVFGKLSSSTVFGEYKNLF